MKYDVLIIGGGIIGLSTGMQLMEKNPGLKVAILEKEDGVAKHQTGNNSGVIHAGVYYKPGSLKAKNCVNGYRKLVEFCEKEGIRYDLCGKLIIATRKDELGRLDNLFDRGKQNGLEKIRKITAEEIKEFEPHAAGIEGIHVPYTGIVDYKEVSKKYAEIFTERLGGDIFLNQKVVDIKLQNNHCEIITGDKSYNSNLIINTAGLYSDKVAALTQKQLNVKIIPFRGEYYEVRPEKDHLVKTLIYPVPDPAFPFLGVHFTRKIGGGIEAGPNAVWAFKREGYKRSDFNLSEFSESLRWKGFRKVMKKYWKMGMGEYWRSYNKSAFTRALQRLLPDIQKDDLVTGGAGVRAQACDKNGGLIDDFLISENEHVLNVLNAPSPAATASLAIGDTISDMAMKKI